MSEDESPEKTQIQITVELANKLKLLMQVGDTYDTVIRKLLNNKRIPKP